MTLYPSGGRGNRWYPENEGVKLEIHDNNIEGNPGIEIFSATPSTANGRQLKRYREALPNLVLT